MVRNSKRIQFAIPLISSELSLLIRDSSTKLYLLCIPLHVSQVCGRHQICVRFLQPIPPCARQLPGAALVELEEELREAPGPSLHPRVRAELLADGRQQLPLLLRRCRRDRLHGLRRDRVQLGLLKPRREALAATRTRKRKGNLRGFLASTSNCPICPKT